ncbi:anti-sigma factor family protein [Streptosporangium carneum]|uniref:anti-sigma factor family protein n=1 Tax=Streptosporangium carneum TaxID=47481 RepID=UPI0022F2BF08|nr:zf-HC2 domain-containing protein [Streptosporangium carneum]
MKRFSCDEWVELVTAYLENDLDEPTRQRFEEHLAECECCGHYLHQFRVTVTALGALPPDPPPDDMRDRLLSAFRNRRDSRVEERRSS